MISSISSNSNFKSSESNFLSSLTFKKETLFLFLSLILFRILCDESYIVTKLVFNYENPFEFNPNNFSKILSWIFLLSFFPFISKIYYGNTISFNVIFLLTLISIVPTSSLIYAYGDYPMDFILGIWLYWILIFILCLKFPIINLDLFKKLRSDILLYSIIIIMGLSIVYISWTNTGFRLLFNIFDSSLIYGIRVEAREYTNFAILGYLQHAADNLFPILMIYLFSRGKKILALILGFLILLNFGITASKQLFLLLILVFFAYFFIKKNISLHRFFIFGILLSTAITLIEFYFLKTAIATMFTSYRIFFIPAKFHFVYFDFFTTFEPDYFRQSFLRILTESNYERPIHMIIADFHNRDYYARANSGLFSDAMMNLGIFGIIFFPFITVIVLKLLDGATKNLSASVNFIVAATVSFLLLNLNISIAVISGGLLSMIVILYCLPRKV